ncbi:MAG: hypothetical protein RLZZ628_1100 [Bacteroidota bacterium]|jgi:hypothetical protein
MTFKKYVSLISVFGFGTLCWSQTKGSITNDGASLILMPKTFMQVVGDVTVQNKGQFVNKGTITLGGHLKQLTKGSYKDTSNSFINFVSNADQIIQSDAVTPVQINNLTVNNQHGLILNGHLAIQKSVELLPNNKIKLGKFNVNLATDIKYTQIGATNYFVTNGDGFVQQSVGNAAAFFHVGNSSYNPMQLFNTGIIDTFEIRVLDSTPIGQATRLPLTEKGVKRLWLLGRHLNTFPLIALELYWSKADELPNLDKSKTMIEFWGTLGSPFPYVSPAQTKGNLLMVSNDLVQLIGKVNLFWVEEPTYINFPPAPAIKVQPNPADSYFTLSTSPENVGKPYSISNMSGNVVKTGKITETNQYIDVSGLPAGIYFMNIGAIGSSRTRFAKL